MILVCCLAMSFATGFQPYVPHYLTPSDYLHPYYLKHRAPVDDAQFPGNGPFFRDGRAQKLTQVTPQDPKLFGLDGLIATVTVIFTATSHSTTTCTLSTTVCAGRRRRDILGMLHKETIDPSAVHA